MSGPFTTGVQASLAPWADSGGVFEKFVGCYSGLFDQVAALVTPSGSPDEPASYAAGWSSLLDPQTCPDQFLPYCGQFVGVQIPTGTSDVSARAMIEAEAGFSTGTLAGVTAAAQQWLTGSQSVTILERTAANGAADAYHFVLIVTPSQVVGVAGLTAAVNAAKPVGVQWTLVQQAGYTWSQAVNDWSADTMTWQQTTNTQP